MHPLFDQPIYCPVQLGQPLPKMPPESGIECLPVVPYEEALEPNESARLAILQKERFQLIANRDLCRRYGWQGDDIAFTPQDFARYLQAKGREAWIVGSQTRPMHIPKHDIDIRFYLSANHYANKTELQDKLEHTISGFIRWRMRQKSREHVRTIPDNISTRLAVYGVAIQIFALPEQPQTPSWALIQLGSLQINALYRARLHSISSSTGGQWSILRSVARWSIGHSFATDHSGFMTAKGYASKRICQISHPQFLHNLIYRLMLEASHGSRFLHSLDRSSPLLKTAVEKFFLEHARDFEWGKPAIITKNLLRYMKEHARTPHKRLADFLYLLRVLQHQPQACAFLAQAFLEIAKLHDADVQIAAFANFAEFIHTHPTHTASFLAVLQGLCICCKWTNQESPAGSIKAYTGLTTEDWRPYFIFKETHFALPFDYYSPLNLATSLLTHWPVIFKIPASTALLKGLFTFLELPAKYLEVDLQQSLQHVKADLLAGFQQHYVIEIIDQFHGKGIATMWSEKMRASHTLPSVSSSMEATKYSEAESKQKDLEKAHLKNLLNQAHRHLAQSENSLETCRFITLMCKLAEPLLNEKELLEDLTALNTLLVAIKTSPEKTTLFDTLKPHIDDFFPHLEANLLHPKPDIRALVVDFYFHIQHALSPHHSSLIFSKILVACKKENITSRHRLIAHGLQNSFFSDPHMRLSFYSELLSSSDLNVLKQAFQLVESALNDSVHDKIKLAWLPTLMRKLLTAQCHREACELLLHLRRHDKQLFQRFLEAAYTQVFRQQLVEAAKALSFLPKDPQATKTALRVLILVLKGEVHETVLKDSSELFSREIAAHFLIKSKRPNLAMRYRLMRLANRLLHNKAKLSSATRSLCLEHLVVKCMETNKKHPRLTVSKSYRQMALHTFKKLAPLFEDSREIQELYQFFLVRMAALIGSKQATFVFLGKALLEHAIPLKHPQRKPLKWLLDKQTLNTRFFETFRRFAVELSPTLSTHSAFQRAGSDLVATDIAEKQDKEEKSYVESPALIIRTSTAWKTHRQRDSSEKLEMTKNAILWLIDNIPVSGKESHTRLFNHCQFIVQGLVEGKKRLSALSEDEQFVIAENLLSVMELLSKASRADTLNETFRLFSLMADMPASPSIRFEKIQSAEKREILDQRRLAIATALLHNFLLRRSKNASENRSQKFNFEAMHFLTRFLLSLDLRSGVAYQLMIRAIAFLPRNPPHALEYKEAVSILSKLCAHSEGALRTQLLLQHCVLRTIKEGINEASTNHLMLAMQLCGQLIEHRLIAANGWRPLSNILWLATKRLTTSKIKLADENLYKWIILPLIETQGLCACNPKLQNEILSALSRMITLKDEWLPQLLPVPQDLLEFYLYRTMWLSEEERHQANRWLEELPPLSSFDPALKNLHTRYHIALKIQSKDNATYKITFKDYLNLTFTEKEMLLPLIVKSLKDQPSLEHFDPRAPTSLFEAFVSIFLPFINALSQTLSSMELEILENYSLEILFRFLDRFEELPDYETFLPFELNCLNMLSQTCSPRFLQDLVLPRLLRHYMSTTSPANRNMALEALKEIHEEFEDEYEGEEYEEDDYMLSYAWNKLFEEEAENAQLLVDNKNITLKEFDDFADRVKNLLILGGNIPLALVEIANLLKALLTCLKKFKGSSSYTIMLQNLNRMLGFAIEKGPFKHLRGLTPEALSNKEVQQLTSAQISLQIDMLDELITPATYSQALNSLEKLRPSYHMLSAHPVYKNKHFIGTEALSYCLFAQDPLQCHPILRHYEQFFLKACHAHNFSFALNCLHALLNQSFTFTAIPLIVDMLIEVFRQRKTQPNARMLSDPNLLMRLLSKSPSLLRKEPYSKLNPGSLPLVLNPLRFMLEYNSDLEAFQKKIQTVSFLKNISEVCLTAIQLYHKSLPMLHALPGAPILESLMPIEEHLANAPYLLKTYLAAQDILALEKECQAIKAHWTPLWDKLSNEKAINFTKKSLESTFGKIRASHYTVSTSKEKAAPLERTEELTEEAMKLKGKNLEFSFAWTPSADDASLKKTVNENMKGIASKLGKPKASQARASADKKKPPLEKKK